MKDKTEIFASAVSQWNIMKTRLTNKCVFVLTDTKQQLNQWFAKIMLRFLNSWKLILKIYLNSKYSFCGKTKKNNGDKI